jgi:hypothetical protein
MDWQRFKEAGSIVLFLVTSIAAFVVAYYGVTSFVDSRIEKQINDADFLKKLARNVRPSLVIDVKGSIIADMEAASYINNISISEGPKDSFIIVVSPVNFLAVEPILEPLDARYYIQGQRGKKFDWIFNLSAISVELREDSALPPREKQRFRLEIIR